MNNELVVAVEEAARLYGASTVDFFKPERRDPMHTAQQLAMYVIRKKGTCSLPEIAKAFDVTHVTVVHNVRQIEMRLSTDEELRTACEKLIKVFEEKVRWDPLVAKGRELLNLQHGLGGCALRVLGDPDIVRLKVMASEKEIVLEVLPTAETNGGDDK